MAKRSRTLVVTLLAAALAVTGCSGSDDKSGDPTGKETDKVAYITAFGAVGRDAFAWVAKEKGYFAEAGIEVDIKEGAGNVAEPDGAQVRSGPVRVRSTSPVP